MDPLLHAEIFSYFPAEPFSFYRFRPCRLLPAPRVIEGVIEEAKPRFDAVVVRSARCRLGLATHFALVFPVITMASMKCASSDRNNVPAYGARKGFVPRIKDDFGDGGAFPEIHVAQYPLDMGRLDKKSTAIVAVSVGGGSGKKAFQSATDLVEKTLDAVCAPFPRRCSYNYGFFEQ